MSLISRGMILGLVLALSACAGAWVRIDEPGKRYVGKHFVAELPVGWVRYVETGTVLVSRDGPDVQRILIHFAPHTQAFSDLNKTTSQHTLPSELAELVIAELKASDPAGMPSLHVVRNAPLEIAGYNGFSLHLSYVTPAGLAYETLIDGFADAKGVYVLYYRAPSLHFFERDRTAFEAVVDSFRPLSG